MIDEVKRLMESNPHYRVLLKTVMENPYIERQVLAERTGLSLDDLDQLLKPLEEKMVVLELASQADSSIESRVPKKIYMINPEIEGDLPAII